MNIIYISSACKPTNIDDINKTATKKLEISGVKFHNLLMKGLEHNEINVISIVGLPISKKTNKKVFWRKKKEKEGNITYCQVGFINIPIFKQLTTAFNIFKTYIKYGKKEKETYTIIDATYVTVLPFVLFVSKMLKIKTIGIVADIYDYMCDVDNNNGKGKIIKNFIKKRNKNMYLKLDGFILLTEKMNEVINLNQKPYLVIEGCSDSNMKDKYLIPKNEKKIILYSGKLSEKFGIKILVEGYKKANIENSELWIYGDGELTDYIKIQSREHPSIKYKGMVSNEEVVKAQMQATLLVNPRPTTEQFTKYSFPSKNIEYMASGTPILTTKLQGMPIEYYKYIFTIEKETVDGIAEAMQEILNKPIGEIYKKGIEAKDFVINEKNENVQAKKIINFVEGEI